MTDPRSLEAERAHQAFHREHNETCSWDQADSLNDGCVIRYMSYRESYGFERGHSFAEGEVEILRDVPLESPKSYVVAFHTFYGSMLEGATPEFVVACADRAAAEKLANELNERADKIDLEGLAFVHEVKQAGNVSADDLLAYWIEQYDEDNEDED